MCIWAVLAVLSFVSGWFAPLFWGIVNWAFGGLNLMIMGSLLISTIQAKKEYKKQMLLLEENKEK